MSHDTSEKSAPFAKDLGAQRHESIHDPVSEKVGYDKSGAVDAENIEHNMTVMQAVKAYPAASWWAFVMSSTIVSSRRNVRHS